MDYKKLLDIVGPHYKSIEDMDGCGRGWLQMFLDDYNAHIHPTGVGPSGPPMPPTPATVAKLSSTHIKYQQKNK